VAATKKKTGCPRTVTPETEELIKLGKELVKWATEEVPLVKGKPKEIRCRFPQWYSLVKGIRESQFDLMKRKDEFVPYYEQAKAALCQRYLDGTICPSIAHRFLRHFAPEVKQEEDDQVKTEAQLKLAELAKVSPEELDKFAGIMSQLDAIRASQAPKKTSPASNKKRSKDRND